MLGKHKEHWFAPGELPISYEIKHNRLVFIKHGGYLHYSVLLSSGILLGSGGAQGSAEHMRPWRMYFSAGSVFLLLNKTSPLIVN